MNTESLTTMDYLNYTAYVLAALFLIVCCLAIRTEFLRRRAKYLEKRSQERYRKHAREQKALGNKKFEFGGTIVWAPSLSEATKQYKASRKFENQS